MGPGRTRWRVLCFAALLLIITPSHAVGQELTGRVSLSPEGTGLSGVDVQLHRITADSGAIVDSVRTDRGGGFRFRIAGPEAEGAVYVASARHDGVLYFGAPLHGGAELPAEYPIAVFDTMLVATPANLDVAMRHVILTPVAGGGIQAEEIIDVAGRTDRTLRGATPDVPAWTERLPEGAHGVGILPGGLTGDEVSVLDGVIGVTSWIPPDGVRMVFRYVLPGAEYRLAPLRRTQRLETIVVGTGIKLEARGIEPSPAGSSGKGMARLSAVDLPAGSDVFLKIEASHPARRWGWIWLVVGLILAAASGVSWRLARPAGSHRD